MRFVIAAMLVVTGVIHLLPLPGVLGAGQLAGLYGLALEDANLVLLMRHRAVLFGLLGLFLIYSAFNAALQRLALAAGLVSVVSFLALAYSTVGISAQVGRVVAADWVALACLVLGVGAWVVRARSRHDRES